MTDGQDPKSERKHYSDGFQFQKRPPLGELPNDKNIPRTPIDSRIKLQTATPPSTGGDIWNYWDSSPLDSSVIRKRHLRRFGTSKAILSLNAETTQIEQIKNDVGDLESQDNVEAIQEPQAELNLRKKAIAASAKGSASRTKIKQSTPQTRATTKESLAKQTSQLSKDQNPPKTPAIQNNSTEKPPAIHIFPDSSGKDPARIFSKRNLVTQRTLFGILIFCLNAACLATALETSGHVWVLVLILFVKAKDILSTVGTILWLSANSLYRRNPKKKDLSRKRILACVTAYAETDVQIMRTIRSILDNAPTSHQMMLTVILDGKPQNLLSHFTSVELKVRRPYQTWRLNHGELNIYAGFMGNMPVILFEKIRNAGKKDSLVLCHDLFNVLRDNAPTLTKLLRTEIWNKILPKLLKNHTPVQLDYLFFTDADSLIHENTISLLAEALTENSEAIAACGLVLAEMSDNNKWSIWYLFQQFQYTFGQFVRRRAEGLWGRVTCLPGCVTMIAVRKEMAGAIKMYSKPINDALVFQHQVQYLGTDRRLTFCMLSQSKHLRTLFVPHAISETVAPQSLLHYLSQRRRWGSNAYFNNYFYFVGRGHWLITRLWAFIDIVRESLVYYRVANTILFIYGLSRHFVFIRIIPYIVVTQAPSIWFLILVLFREPLLRKQAHRLILGMIINKIIATFLSIIIFSRIILNLGNAGECNIIIQNSH
jgi:hypothetical protein